VEGDRKDYRSSDCFALLKVLEGLAVSDSKRAEALADSLEAQFQQVNDPLEPAAVDD
jgi:archaellum component FlaG (FlaF/FlaG flagellin family)